MKKALLICILVLIAGGSFSVSAQEAISVEDLPLVMVPDDYFSDEGLTLNAEESGTFPASADDKELGLVGSSVKKWYSFNLDSTRSCTLYEYEIDILLFESPTSAANFVDQVGFANGEVANRGIGVDGCLGTLLSGMSQSLVLKAVGPFVIISIAVFDPSWYTTSSIETSIVESLDVVEKNIQDQGWVDSDFGVLPSSLESMLLPNSAFDDPALILQDPADFITVERWVFNLRNFFRGHSAAQIEQSAAKYGLGGLQTKAWSDANYTCSTYSYYEVGVMPFTTEEGAQGYFSDQDMQDAYILDGIYIDFNLEDDVLWAEGESHSIDCGMLRTVRSAWKVHGQFIVSIWVSYYPSEVLTDEMVDQSILASIGSIESNIGEN